MAAVIALALVGTGTIALLTSKAHVIKRELELAMLLAPQVQHDISRGAFGEASEKLVVLKRHTSAARQEVEGPAWSFASAIPVLGKNFSTAAEIARSADDIINLGVSPLVEAASSLKWGSLLPTTEGIDLGPMKAASPSFVAAAYAFRASEERLRAIDGNELFPQVSQALNLALDNLQRVSAPLDVAASAAQLAPNMLGVETPRQYLLMIQNNAESRATGGIPGALAILTLDNGKVNLSAQSSASDINVMTPPVPAEPQQTAIYSGRLGKFMQDVNLTPDFPTSARLAQQMWEKESGERVSGVLSIDPVVLSYVLGVTGPVNVLQTDSGLPTELTSKNVVPTLLSDVYAEIDNPQLQDVYFAEVARQIFAEVSGGKSDTKGLIDAISRGAEEGRVLLWSDSPNEQEVLGQYSLSGSISGPSISPAQFGVYFNDGTGAKMDYYVKRTVQLIKECPKDGYEKTTVRVTSTNTAPADAATSLPAYVTGDGVFGVPPGTVQTNLVAYGPIQAQVETAKLDGQKTAFAPYFHSNRPVGVLAVQLAPGERKTVDFTFGKIVQHAEPNVVVTPTVQDVKDVTLPTETSGCG